MSAPGFVRGLGVTGLQTLGRGGTKHAIYRSERTFGFSRSALEYGLGQQSLDGSAHDFCR